MHCKKRGKLISLDHQVADLRAEIKRLQSTVSDHEKIVEKLKERNDALQDAIGIIRFSKMGKHGIRSIWDPL